MKDRLTKNSSNRVLCGVCGAIADYFDIDPTLVRIGTVVLGIVFPPTIIIYLISGLIIPKN